MPNLNDEGLDTQESKRKMNEYMNFQTPGDQAEQYYIDSGQADEDYKREQEGIKYANMYCSVLDILKERFKLKKENKEMRLLSLDEQEYLFQIIEDLDTTGEFSDFEEPKKNIEFKSDDKNNVFSPVLPTQYESDIKPEDLPF